MDSTSIITLLITQSLLLLFGIIAGYVKLTSDRNLLRSQTEAKIREMEESIIGETKLKHAKEQLSDFYGPIRMLLLTNNSLFTKSYGTDAWNPIRKSVLLPNNNTIAEIVINKIHLLDDDQIPDSFKDFIEHAFLWNVYAETETGITLDYLEKNATFPREFAHDIENGYSNARAKYLRIIHKTSGTP